MDAAAAHRGTATKEEVKTSVVSEVAQRREYFSDSMWVAIADGHRKYFRCIAGPKVHAEISVACGSISSVSVIQNECGPTWLSRTASARVAVKGRGATRMFEMRSLQERVPEGGLLPLVGQADDSKSQWEATSQEVCSARRAKEE